MIKPIFYDPERKRWKRLRRIFDIVAVLSTVVLVASAVNVLIGKGFLNCCCRCRSATIDLSKIPTIRPNRGRAERTLKRKRKLRPSDIPLNAGEGLRAAYYVDYDAASLVSLKSHIHDIDLLFTDWLHVITPDGKLTAYTLDNHAYAVVDATGVHNIDPGGKVAGR